MTNITLTQEDFEDLLIYAQRYSIGRMTYAPHTVCRIIMDYMAQLSVNTLNVIKIDIEERLACGKEYLGDFNIDYPVWIETLKAINLELHERMVES